MASAAVDAPLDAVRDILRGRVGPKTRLAVGLSGGLDSVVLLNLLHRLRPELGYSLAAIHVHHGLSPHADSWADFCAELCRGLAVPLQVERVHVARLGGDSLEAAARRARYRAYAGLDVDYVVLAHQQDDQVETILLNLLRGTGVAGMAGMPIERALPGSRVRLLRPLLLTPRASLEHYARNQALAWVEDESNLDAAYARNYLRWRVLPEIAARFPAYRDNLTRAAAHFAECSALLTDLARQDAERAVGPAGLEVKVLSQLSRARAKNLLRWYLREQGAGVWPEARLADLLDQLLLAGPDACSEIKVGQVSLRRWRGRLQCTPATAAPAAEQALWQGEASLPFAGGRITFDPVIGAGVSLARLEGATVTVRKRAGGERLRPDCKRPRREVKKLCQEQGIPPWERDRLPMLYVGSQLAWVGHLGTDCAFQAKAGEPGLLIAWHPGG